MKRLQLLLAALLAVLLVVAAYFLVFQSREERIDELRAQITQEEEQQAALQSQLDQLRDVRERAPELEAHLAAARIVLPNDPRVPALYRQLQTAADDAGVELQSINVGRPTQQEAATEGLSGLSIALQISGSYFQAVDLLRRIEEPAITGRGIVWESLTLTRDDQYPELSISLSGQAYALLPSAPPEVEEPEEPAQDGTDGTDDDADDDVDDADGTDDDADGTDGDGDDADPEELLEEDGA